MFQAISLRLAFACSLAAFLPTLSHAGISKSDCENIRALNKQKPYPFYFQSGRDFLPLDKDNEKTFWTEVRNQDPDNDGFTFVYLAKSDDDPRSTLFLIKQRFGTASTSEAVAIYNNIRKRGQRIPLGEYQDYHGKEGHYRNWVQWLHLGPGWFFNRDFVDSKEAPLPRKFFAIDESQKGGEIKTYLIAVRGIHPDGSCVDFSPYVSTSTSRISISIRNLRRTETDDFRDPLTLSAETGE